MSVTEEIKAGRNVAKRAAAWRTSKRHKVSPKDPTRQADLEALLAQIDETMKPIRSAIGKLLWHAEFRRHEDALRAASTDLQYQRKQLKKMRR